MKKRVEVTPGDIFGHMTVLYELPTKANPCGSINRMVKVMCVCGTEVDAYLWNLIKRKSNTSCGCMSNMGSNFYTHGLSDHPLHKVWLGMKSRCYQPKHPFYKYYGGEGIKICDEWLNDFRVFYDWGTTNGWKHNLTIDRFPNKRGNYEPNNCRFVTMKENCNNRRNSILFDYNGTLLSLPQISELENIKYSKLYHKVTRRKIDVLQAVGEIKNM